MSNQLEQYIKKIVGNYTASEDDYRLLVDTTNGVVNIYLDTPIRKDVIIIEDLGNASNNAIKIHSNKLINGSSTYILNSNQSSLELRYSSLNDTFTANLLDNAQDFIFVYSKEDLPEASNGVITLTNYATYYFLNDIDLFGDRIVCGINNTILGSSSENASLTSTGIGNDYLITSIYTLPIRHITFKDVNYAIDINSSGQGSNIALDWTGVNFSGCLVNLTCGNIDNFVFSKGAILGSGKFEFLANAGTIAIDNSLFTGNGQLYDIIEIGASAVISRRFRIIYSSFVAFGSTVAINVNSSATIPTEGYILDTINFSGGSTYLSGVQYTSNKTRFVNCKGIENTAELGNYYMLNNATATTISQTETPVKIAGTTTANAINQKFSHTDNRLTYTGSLIRDFQISANASFTSGNNQVIGLYVAKNGSVIASSEMYATTSGSGRAESINCQTIVELNENDYVEMWIENETSASNITVEYLNVIVKSLN